MPAFIDHTGATQQIEVGVADYRQAAEAGMSLRQHLNAIYPTRAERDGTAFEQILASEGISLRNDPKAGVRASTVREMVEGTGPQMKGAVTKEAVPASRILFPAAVMSLVEDRLAVDISQTDSAFNSIVAYEESINGDRVDQPVINYSNAASNAPQTIAQLAMPASMITITASDKSYKLPVYSQGIEVSDQAAQNTTIDLVALTLARSFALQANVRAQGYMLALKDGDVDNNDSSLTSLGYATTQTLMDAAPVSGAITHKAWMNWLTRNTDKRRIDIIVTDFATALKIENRTGKPVVTSDNPTSPRIDTLMQVLNPVRAPSLKVFLVQPGSGWPADTIMGLDSRYAVRRIRSLTASFQSTEAFITRRSTVSRFDYGEIVNRMFPEAFDQFTIV